MRSVGRLPARVARLAVVLGIAQTSLVAENDLSRIIAAQFEGNGFLFAAVDDTHIGALDTDELIALSSGTYEFCFGLFATL
jgi:hypothetical protein